MSSSTSASALSASAAAAAAASDSGSGSGAGKPLAGRVAVITGGSSGIGAATAEHLAGLGASVAALARRTDRLEDLVARIGKNGGTAIAVAADVSDPDAVQAAADRVEAELGGADLLFNNAGVMLPAPVEERTTELWQRQIDVNVSGLMYVIGAFVPQLLRAAEERGVADLINTSSIGAQNIYPNFAVYTGTKAYVSHMSRNLRVELGPKKVRVSTLEPGLVKTELQTHVTDDGALEWLDEVRESLEWLTPEDVAGAVGYLAGLPPRVNFQQLTLMPTGQLS
ncbi:SDR family oxidoreductase [Streptomyces sp. NPDC051217]|uniref:SDR family oxidoreductase n=1 Tax=Streptomyces sp. NPDC051217 TaxID=3365644 RepID=UPI0037900007